MVDLVISFLRSGGYLQNVAYGEKIISFHNGKHLAIPAVKKIKVLIVLFVDLSKNFIAMQLARKVTLVLLLKMKILLMQKQPKRILMKNFAILVVFLIIQVDVARRFAKRLVHDA